MMRSKTCWKVLIVTAIMAAGGEAQAQNGGARYDGEVAAGVFQRIDPGSRWGRGLELSEGGRAQNSNEFQALASSRPPTVLSRYSPTSEACQEVPIPTTWIFSACPATSASALTEPCSSLSNREIASGWP